MKEYTCEKCEALNKKAGAENGYNSLVLCDNCWDIHLEGCRLENYRSEYYQEQKKQS